MHAGAHGGQMRALDPPELELEVVLAMWVLATNPGPLPEL